MKQGSNLFVLSIFLMGLMLLTPLYAPLAKALAASATTSAAGDGYNDGYGSGDGDGYGTPKSKKAKKKPKKKKSSWFSRKKSSSKTKPSKKKKSSWFSRRKKPASTSTAGDGYGGGAGDGYGGGVSAAKPQSRLQKLEAEAARKRRAVAAENEAVEDKAIASRYESQAQRQRAAAAQNEAMAQRARSREKRALSAADSYNAAAEDTQPKKKSGSWFSRKRSSKKGTSARSHPKSPTIGCHKKHVWSKTICTRADGSTYNQKTGKQISGPTAGGAVGVGGGSGADAAGDGYGGGTTLGLDGSASGAAAGTIPNIDYTGRGCVKMKKRHFYDRKATVCVHKDGSEFDTKTRKLIKGPGGRKISPDEATPPGQGGFGGGYSSGSGFGSGAGFGDSSAASSGQISQADYSGRGCVRMKKRHPYSLHKTVCVHADGSEFDTSTGKLIKGPGGRKLSKEEETAPTSAMGGGFDDGSGFGGGAADSGQISHADYSGRGCVRMKKRHPYSLKKTVCVHADGSEFDTSTGKLIKGPGGRKLSKEEETAPTSAMGGGFDDGSGFGGGAADSGQISHADYSGRGCVRMKKRHPYSLKKTVCVHADGSEFDTATGKLIKGPGGRALSPEEKAGPVGADGEATGGEGEDGSGTEAGTESGTGIPDADYGPRNCASMKKKHFYSKKATLCVHKDGSVFDTATGKLIKGPGGRKLSEAEAAGPADQETASGIPFSDYSGKNCAKKKKEHFYSIHAEICVNADGSEYNMRTGQLIKGPGGKPVPAGEETLPQKGGAEDGGPGGPEGGPGGMEGDGEAGMAGGMEDPQGGMSDGSGADGGGFDDGGAGQEDAASGGGFDQGDSTDDAGDVGDDDMSNDASDDDGGQGDDAADGDDSSDDDDDTGDDDDDTADDDDDGANDDDSSDDDDGTADDDDGANDDDDSGYDDDSADDDDDSGGYDDDSSDDDSGYGDDDSGYGDDDSGGYDDDSSDDDSGYGDDDSSDDDSADDDDASGNDDDGKGTAQNKARRRDHHRVRASVDGARKANKFVSKDEGFWTNENDKKQVKVTSALLGKPADLNAQVSSGSLGKDTRLNVDPVIGVDNQGFVEENSGKTLSSISEIERGAARDGDNRTLSLLRE